jgi:hypothetical protein
MFQTVLRSLLWLTAGLVGLSTAVATGTHRDTPPPPAAVDVTVELAPAPHAVSPTDAENPRVAPGLVKWHASFADAQAAARKSGKPVLLFHMMGQLDRQFC